MQEIIWTDEFSVGVARIDEQHRRLVEMIIFLHYVPDVPSPGGSESLPRWPHPEDIEVYRMQRPRNQTETWTIHLEDVLLKDYPEMAGLDSWVCDPPTFLRSFTQYDIQFEWVDADNTDSQDDTAHLRVELPTPTFSEEQAKQYASEAFKCAVAAYRSKPSDPYMK